MYKTEDYKMEDKKWFNQKNTSMVVLGKRGSFIKSNGEKYRIERFVFIYTDTAGVETVVNSDNIHSKNEEFFLILFNENKNKAIIMKNTDGQEKMEQIQIASLIWKLEYRMAINGLFIHAVSANELCVYTYIIWGQDSNKMMEALKYTFCIEKLICHQEISQNQQIDSIFGIEKNKISFG